MVGLAGVQLLVTGSESMPEISIQSQLLQVALLIASVIVCERLSYEELRKDYESRVKEPEDEDED